MNHHYPDSYHGYVREAPGMAYSRTYTDPSAMARMGQPRENYQASSYREDRNMNSMMQQQQAGMYDQGGFVPHQGGNPYSMGGYATYGMHRMNEPSLMMGNRPDMNRISGGNMINPFYNSSISENSHAPPQHRGMPGHAASYNQAQTTPLLQQQHQMTLMPTHAQMSQMSGQASSQPTHGHSAQSSQSPSHHLPQTSPHPPGSGYGSQNSPHMMPPGHHVPQHPMRHSTTQQNPQEVADNILQMASSYPSNQTVQVPLKSRPAPYHIPRSPHYVSHSELPHVSPNPHNQQQQSPAPPCQTSPSPSSTSVKSPTPVLAPIPNPIPSPGISGVRSSCNQGTPTCGGQRSPVGLGSAYSGHSQIGLSSQHGHGTPPSLQGTTASELSQGHFLSCSLTPNHNYPSYSSPPSTHRNPSMYPLSCDAGGIPLSERIHQNTAYTSSTSASPSTSCAVSYHSSLHQNSGKARDVSEANVVNNPLMSLQKLVMLPETQVVDPKSVVNDACLSSEQRDQDEGPKNVDGPAEWLAEDSSFSVGCQKLSPHGAEQAVGCYPSEGSENIKSAVEVFPSGSSDNTQSIIDAFSDSCNNTFSGVGVPPFNDPQNIAPDSNLFLADVTSTTQSGASMFSPKDSSSSGVGPTDDSINTSAFSNDTPCENHKAQKISEPMLNCYNGHLNGSVSGSDEMFGEQNKSEELAHKTSPQRPEISSLEPPSKTAANDTDVSGFEDANHKVTLNASDNTRNEMHDDPGTICKPENNPLSVGNEELPKNNNGHGMELNQLSKGFEETESTKMSESEAELMPAQKNKLSSSYFLEKRNVKVKEEPKLFGSQSWAPSVLSEVPVLTNGVSGTACTGEDVDQECDKGGHAKVQNGYTSIARTKLGLTKKASHILSMTPCSIAVGADERAACERFAFRRNGLCRTLRTSRIICSSRNRSDSTGNGDSDESLENLSETSVEVSGIPQDGNRKRTSSKRGNCKKTDKSPLTAESKLPESASKSAEKVDTNSNGRVSYNTGEVSDDEMSYYEGVDNTDIFVNNFSSDESLNSSGEVKQNITPVKTNVELEKQEDKTDDISKKESGTSSSPDNSTLKCLHSPPSKRICRSSGQKAQEKLKDLTLSSRILSNNKVNEEKETVVDIKEPHSKTGDSSDETKLPRPRNRRVMNVRGNQFKSLDFNHGTDVKYPVVLLEKSNVAAHQSPIKTENDLVDPTLKPPPHEEDVTLRLESGEVETQSSGSEISVKVEVMESSLTSKMDSTCGNEEGTVDTLNNDSKSAVVLHDISEKRRPKKKPHRRKNANKSRGKRVVNRDRNSELKDSFKSMKFSRTLDQMKNHRRKDIASSAGPFIRVTKNANSPVSVTVFNQTAQDLSLPVGKHKSKGKQPRTPSATTTVHIVTNLPSGKTAMVPSSRTTGQNQWECAFCSHHSSYLSLGDLFGPYYKDTGIPQVKVKGEKEDKDLALKDQKYCNTAGSSSRNNEFTPQASRLRKTLLKQSPPPPPSPEEVWVHEVCAMWSPGVYLLGGKLFGLSEAIRDAEETSCSVCKHKGAMIGCLYKGCPLKYHVICALDKECYMDEENLSLLCPKHKSKRLQGDERS